MTETGKNGKGSTKSAPKKNTSSKALSLTKATSTKKASPKKGRRSTTTVTTKVRKVVKRVRKKNDKKIKVKKEKPDFPVSKENKIILENKGFRSWEDDEFVTKVLKARGWTYLGSILDNGRVDYPHSMYEAKDQGHFEGDPVLIWADDDDSKVLQGSQHVLNSIPYIDKCLTKVNQQKMFNEYDWFPTCFTLPKEKAQILRYIEENPESYWIAKPRDSYGGFGMCVFKSGSPEFMNMIARKTTFVVQEYMKNPYLLAGLYKFHFRCYMVITNVTPCRAYLWRNAQLQFCTHEFNLEQIEKSFNKYSHITNFKVNNEKKNKKYLIQDKPGIGIGTEWPYSTFLAYMKKNDRKFNDNKFWNKIAEITGVVAERLCNQRKVVRAFKKKAKTTHHWEILGMDILFDENCGVYMTEANTSPGLDFTDPIMINGKFNEQTHQANLITEGIINDAMTLTGLDDFKKDYFSPFMRVK